jgi:hypothetical protein
MATFPFGGIQTLKKPLRFGLSGQNQLQNSRADDGRRRLLSTIFVVSSRQQKDKLIHIVSFGLGWIS